MPVLAVVDMRGPHPASLSPTYRESPYLAGMFKLVIADEEGKTFPVPLVRDEVTIGRKEGNTIRLTERNVSRRHAKLRRDGANFVIEDLGSYNGVKVNGKKISAETTLQAGDQVGIGEYQISLQLEDGAAAVAADGGGAGPVPAPAVPSARPAAPAPGAVVAASRDSGPPGSADSAASLPARLVMMSPPAPGAEFSLRRPVTRIGRAEELEVWVNHRSISREHAQVRSEGGTLRLSDLGSANGTRLNGADVEDAVLTPGDVVELGQVRFRFVGAGESFVFEADRTMQMDAVSLPSRGPNRTPMLVAAGIVGLALIGGAVVAMSGSPPTTVVSLGPTAGAPGALPAATGTIPAAAGGAALTGAAATESATRSVASCRAALNAGQFDAARQHAEQALAALPGDASATSCRDDAQREQGESDAFGRGLSAMRSGDAAGACLAFDALPAQSPFRARPEVRQAATQFASQSLSRADGLLSSDPAEALRLAEAVAGLSLTDAATRRQADALARRARPRASAALSAAVAVAAPAAERPSPAARAAARSAAPAARAATSSARTGAPAAPAPVVAAARPEPTPAAAGAEPASPLVAARLCLATGDNACAVRALEGRARTPQEWRLLISTYHAMQNSAQERRAMETFTTRFPSDPATQAYRQALARP